MKQIPLKGNLDINSMVYTNDLLSGASIGIYIHIPDNSRLLPRSITRQRPSSKAAVFLDRDGVIVEDVNFLLTLEQLRLLPGVCQALRKLQEWFYIIVITNQSGIARGILPEQGLEEIHSELVKLLTLEDIVLDAIYYCPHLPESSIPAYSKVCDCRKPLPGMLLQAAEDWGIDIVGSFVVGDSLRDIEAGKSIGVPGILVGEHDKKIIEEEIQRASDLLQATDLIIKHGKTYHNSIRNAEEQSRE